MCFSAAANFVGSTALGAIGVVTLTKVKHRRELLFASLPILFAIHQFIEGFVWLGLDGILSPAVTHDMGAAFMLYAQGLLPFLLPLSVLLFEPDGTGRRRMLPFLAVGTGTTLYILWALTAFPTQVYVKGSSIVYINQATNNTAVAVLYVIATCGSLFFSKVRAMVLFGAGKHGHSADCDGVQALCLHFAVVCVRGDCKCDHTGLLLEEQQTASADLCEAFVGADLGIANPQYESVGTF